MRFTIILIMLVLLPILVAVHLWDYAENRQLRLIDQATGILKKHGVRGGTVDVRFLDLSITGDAQDEPSLKEASRELAELGPLRLVSNRLSILARVRARLAEETLTIDGWMADQDTADSLRGLLTKLRPDLKLVMDDLKISSYVRWPEGEKLPLEESSPMLKPIISALRVPAALDIKRQEGRLIVTGMIPSQDLKEAIKSALDQPAHGLAVDVSKLRVSSHVLPAAFTDQNAILPFLRSFYDTPSPGEFSILPDQSPQLKADTTRSLESAWLSALRPVTGGMRVDMQLIPQPSIFHFPGRRIQTALPEEVLQNVRNLISHHLIVFAPGSSTLAAEQRTQLTLLVPALLGAGPALRLVVGGHPEPGGEAKLEASLAMSRAEEVASFLIEQGAPCMEIRTMAFDPVPAGDAHAPEQPRSVEILIQ
ncbi:MAG: OmpA family protein [Verrucomicrobia bacterium]|nr:OmpA family protein [Verrucomicrobiota bacterium]